MLLGTWEGNKRTEGKGGDGREMRGGGRGLDGLGNEGEGREMKEWIRRVGKGRGGRHGWGKEGDGREIEIG